MTVTEIGASIEPVMDSIVPIQFNVRKTRESLFEQIPKEDQLGELGQCSSFLNKQNLRIASYFWPSAAKKIKAVVLFVHGHGSYLMHDILNVEVCLFPVFSPVFSPVVRVSLRCNIDTPNLNVQLNFRVHYLIKSST